MSSIKDVAKKAGVSIASVSRVMSGKGYVGAEATKRVEKAIRELQYRPNRLARSLREQQSRVIGLIVSDISNPFFSEITKSVEEVALQHGYSVLICNTNEDPEHELRCLHLMVDENVAGVLISPTLTGCKKFAEYQDLKLPIVVFDRKPSGGKCDSIVIDNRDSALQLTRALIDGGYRHIAGIFGQKSYTAAQRMKGFKDAMQSAGLEPAALIKSPSREADGDKITGELLKRQPEVDAILTSSALLAIGAYKAIRRTGKPLGFACFDNASWTEFVQPPATTIQQPTKLIGSSATELLINRINDPTRSISETCLKGELINRIPPIGVNR
ncbi:LacI family DNA-binding transcriptional regulator [Kiritimatiellaeota bacterium B1221]|nr:LacI family DNA-binding transcriptional regulator [Kiritimatiellaeota bacterium B1221]